MNSRQQVRVVNSISAKAVRVVRVSQKDRGVFW